MRRLAVPLFACALLAACASSTSYSTVVTSAQSLYNVAEAGANAAILSGDITAADASVIQKIEAVDDPLVAALSTTTAPTSITALLNDVKTIVNALPTSAAKTDAETGLGIAQVALAAYLAETAVAPVTSPTAATTAVPTTN